MEFLASPQKTAASDKMETQIVREAVEDLLKAVNTVGQGRNPQSLDSLLSILDSILTHPYVDAFRIIDLTYFKSKFAKFP